MGDIMLRSLVDAIGWQVAIYTAGTAGVILTVAIWMIVRDSHPSRAPLASEVLSFPELFAGLWLAVKNPQIWLNGLVGLLMYLSLSAFAELWIQYLRTGPRAF